MVPPEYVSKRDDVVAHEEKRVPFLPRVTPLFYDRFLTITLVPMFRVPCLRSIHEAIRLNILQDECQTFKNEQHRCFSCLHEPTRVLDANSFL